MKLDGAHHLTMITSDAQRTIDFYSGVLGLRLVKTTVDVERPEIYHLYFGDETGAPGSILTWLELQGATPGQAGAGMVHTIQLAVASTDALRFWATRLRAAGVDARRSEATLILRDPDGMALELVVAAPANPPLVAGHPEVPPEHALTGLQGARAYGSPGWPDTPACDVLLTDTLGFSGLGDGEYRVLGEHRQFAWAYDPPPCDLPREGAGTVHHIAWTARDVELPLWRDRVARAGAAVTEVRDCEYFRSIRLRDPAGVRFEIATRSPGFSVDESTAHLGEQLRLPAQHEHLRSRLVRTLVPLSHPRAGRRESIGA